MDSQLAVYGPAISIDQLYSDHYALLELNYEMKSEYLVSVKEQAGAELALPAKYAQLEDVGVRHNALLMALDENNTVPIQQADYSDDDLIARDIIQTEEFKAAYQNSLYSALDEMTDTEGLDIEQRIDYYLSQEDDPVAKQVMELLKEVYLTYPNKMSDVDFVINHYIQTIEASNEIVEEEKEALYRSFAVAAYSPRFWDSIGYE